MLLRHVKLEHLIEMRRRRRKGAQLMHADAHRAMADHAAGRVALLVRQAQQTFRDFASSGIFTALQMKTELAAENRNQRLGFAKPLA